MKNLTLIAAAAATLLFVPALHAQTTSTTTTTKVSINARDNARTRARLRAIEQGAATQQAVVLKPRTDGSVVRAVRSGNPLQMVNPFAPAEYGNGHDVTRHEAEDPNQRPEGLKLATVEF